MMSQRTSAWDDDHGPIDDAYISVVIQDPNVAYGELEGFYQLYLKDYQRNSAIGGEGRSINPIALEMANHGTLSTAGSLTGSIS